MTSIAIYCGSKSGHRPEHAGLAQATGAWLAQHQVRLVFGGGRVGLMGILADAVLAGGGEVMGVIPKGLDEREVAHTGLTQLVVVDNMHDRKQRMADEADAFLVLPGSIGTMDEFFEIWTWRQLGIHRKPIGLLNAGGYYDHLLHLMSHIQSEGFMGEETTRLVCVDHDVTRLLATLLDQIAQGPGELPSWQQLVAP